MSAIEALRLRLSDYQRLWTSEIPPDSYALLRIALGLVGLTALVGLTPVDMYWLPDGLLPLTSGRGVPRDWLMAHGLGAVAGWSLYLTLWVVWLSLTIGLFSDAAVIAAFVAQIVQARWNNSPLSAAHQVETVLLFCLLWVPTGRVWSIDALRRRAASIEVRCAAWPLYVMRFQVALIYFSSALSKLAYPVWRDGSAVYWALNLNDFHRFPWVIPESAAPVLALITWTTLAFELLFPFLVISRRTRPAVLWAGVGLHLGLWAMLELGPFSWVMLASYLAFLDPEKTPALLPWRRPNSAATLSA